MKNKLLSIVGAILLSCQYAPTQAQIVDNSLNTTSLNPVGVRLSLCESLAEFAEGASNARQNGVSYEFAVSVAPKPRTQAEKDVKPILDEILYAAYQLDIVDSAYGKAYLSKEFSKRVYVICVGDFL